MFAYFKKISFAYKVALVYLCIGSLWIIYSDAFLLQLDIDNVTVLKMQSVKGIFYVIATTLLLFLLVKRHLTKIDEADTLINLRNNELENQNNELKSLTLLAERRANQLLTLLDNAPEAVLIVVEHTIVYFNHSCTELYGADGDEQLLNTSVFERIHPAHQAIVKVRIEQMMLQRQPNTPSEYKQLKLDGTVIDTEVKSVPIEYDGKDAVLVFVRDITAHKQATEQLNQAKESAVESQQLFKAIADTSPLAIYISTGLEEKGEYLNPTFERLFGYTLNEIPYAINWYKLAYPDEAYRELLVTEWKKRAEIAIINNSHIEPMEAIVTCKDGSLKHVLWGFISIGSRNWVFGLDLTESKRTEAELKAAKQKAEESDRLKSVFLQNMSHEIRTPMNAIVGFSELLPTYFDEKDKLLYFSDIIKRRSYDLLSLINDILDLSKIEAGQLTAHKEICQLRAVLDELYQFFSNHPKLQQKSGLQLYIDTLPLPPQTTIVVDDVKLKQIFINLIANALKFTPKGLVAFGFDRIEGNEIRFFVRDTGVGIPSEKLGVIFDRFIQLDNSPYGAKGGTGLGLPIVKGLVKLMDGDITVHSEVNVGSTFYFTLPCIEDVGIKKRNISQ